MAEAGLPAEPRRPCLPDLLQRWASDLRHLGPVRAARGRVLRAGEPDRAAWAAPENAGHPDRGRAGGRARQHVHHRQEPRRPHPQNERALSERSRPARAEGREPPTLRLASASPRRRLLLPLIGLPVEVGASAVDEEPLAGETGEQTARRLALAKASALCPGRPNVVTIGSDTVVVYRGRQLGKPADAEEATRMLRFLSGRMHRVVTAVAVSSDTEISLGHVSTRVRMRLYHESEIEAYVRSGRPMDKAGAYAIQDEDFG
ncbi:MAG: septum formation protein Maf, partial [Chloroflexi bacterium]|nr:septum formation protein Maf [Chloroflexota bacterium]